MAFLKLSKVSKSKELLESISPKVQTFTPIFTSIHDPFVAVEEPYASHEGARELSSQTGRQMQGVNRTNDQWSASSPASSSELSSFCENAWLDASEGTDELSDDTSEINSGFSLYYDHFGRLNDSFSARLALDDGLAYDFDNFKLPPAVTTED
mmetsp:Transcript_5195/g.6149  ORF Transcript_5195/g.6149 Transcript_5195/m.6149 type:complete len:153 (+) Transcript_5195:53-511(+)